jgi:hypothetical protein
VERGSKLQPVTLRPDIVEQPLVAVDPSGTGAWMNFLVKKCDENQEIKNETEREKDVESE